MTAGKAIDRLVVFAPAIIAANAKPGGRCVLATAIGIDVLERFDVAAVPVSVRLRLANGAYLAHAERGMSAVGNVANGGHLIDTGSDADPLTGTTTSDRGWHGHLVMALPGVSLIDLDLQQLHRPQYGIVLPLAARFEWLGLRVDRAAGREFPINGNRIRYDVRPNDQSWADAKDWIGVSRRRHIVDAIERCIRKGKP